MRVQIEKLIELQGIDKEISTLLKNEASGTPEALDLGIFEKLSKKKKERSSVLKKMEDRILKRYERLRGTKGESRAVVPVMNGVCQGCFIGISTATLAELRRGNLLLTCDHCGRYIYYLA